MSVEKFIVTKEDSGYTVIPNNIIRFFQKNLELLGFWLSLSSLPPQWEFHKSKIKSDYKIGRDKLDRFLNILEQCNLLQIRQCRNADGTFGDGELHIKSGRDFVPIPENQLTVSNRALKIRGTVNQLLDTAHYKRKNNKINKKQEKRESPREREPKRAAHSLSENFKPDQEREAKAKAVSQRCGIEVDTLLAKFKAIEKRKARKAVDWQTEFDLFLLREKPAIAVKTTNTQEPRSTVKEFDRIPDVKRASIDTVKDNMTKIRQQLKGILVNGDLDRVRTG